ncbi:MAG: hypothetical protein DWQ34_20960 [Planctomycetota bacterium]|nr:MAG: hypothetical protein DWQ34_20960 [Planctomycetota bacterium]REK21625.1 MAG: hypothetical protein DWQ41_20780 [Planctomycetota bacterium]REK29982.1 MAG: hypothetical protein DWQ45_22155 [Planctomycetota bacterium]
MRGTFAVRIVVVATIVTTSVLPTRAGERFLFIRQKSPLEKAAIRLDKLEEELLEEGTIVIKAPDVWGESRLTKHRQEFERVLEDKVSDFQLLLNASMRRSDQAYLANALAIQAAVQTPSIGEVEDSTVNLPTTNDMAFVSSLTTGTIAGDPGDTAVPINRTAVTQLDAGTGFNFTGFSGTEGGVPAVGLEPTIQLDQLKRYLDHLHEIRRVNEGDDTADSPGYSLNLVRVPVSILPGEETRKGHGADIEITAKAHLTTELLPRVYRELVINDLVDLLGVAILRISDAIDDIAYVEHGCGKERTTTWWYRHNEQCRLQYLLTGYRCEDTVATSRHLVNPLFTDDDGILRAPTVENQPELRKSEPLSTLSPEYNAFDSSVRRASGTSTSVNVEIAARNSRQPLAAAQLIETFGREELIVLAYEFWKRKPHEFDAHLPDARAFLSEHLNAGYDYLRTPDARVHWDLVPIIHDQVRANRVSDLEAHRRSITGPGFTNLGTDELPVISGEAPSPVAICAWWVLVESSLLNQQLNDDLKRVSQDPECGCMWAGEFPFYGIDPPMEARQAFVKYVKCRWPIHVFALDPVVQQQNIADQYSMRREMQLALALAFASGNLSAQNMTRYARRLELDMETVALNQTHVGFGHGDNVFGWRFTPRVQTPDVGGTGTVIFRDFLFGGPNRDHMRSDWELEPGMRECVAIVLMPSFIEHVTFHSRGYFFELSDRDDATASLRDTVRWSEALGEAECLLAGCYSQPDRFQASTVERLHERIEQLATKLPLQTVHSRVPNENTLGGFEMFSSGITDLGPELLDFYGHPGVNLNKDTELFLVGNHFSVHDTHVIAGNRECPFWLISRQVMKVTIPAGVQPVDLPIDRETGCGGRFVDVHIATPYGVSAHLDIPVLDSPKISTEYTWARREMPIQYRFKYTPAKAPEPAKYEVADVNILVVGPQELAFDVPPYGEQTVAVELFLTVEANQAPIMLPLPKDYKPAFTFDSKRKQQVLRGNAYGEFHRNVRDAVESYLATYFPNGNPQGPIDVTVRGRTAKQEVAGDFHLLIQLEAAN